MVREKEEEDDEEEEKVYNLKKEGSRTDERRIRSIIWRKTTTEH